MRETTASAPALFSESIRSARDLFSYALRLKRGGVCCGLPHPRKVWSEGKRSQKQRREEEEEEGYYNEKKEESERGRMEGRGAGERYVMMKRWSETPWRRMGEDRFRSGWGIDRKTIAWNKVDMAFR